MPPRMVVGSGMGGGPSYGGSGMSGSSGVAPRRSRGIRSSFNKDSELVEPGATADGLLLMVAYERTLCRIRQCAIPLRYET